MFILDEDGVEWSFFFSLKITVGSLGLESIEQLLQLLLVLEIILVAMVTVFRSAETLLFITFSSALRMDERVSDEKQSPLIPESAPWERWLDDEYDEDEDEEERRANSALVLELSGVMSPSGGSRLDSSLGLNKFEGVCLFTEP